MEVGGDDTSSDENCHSADDHEKDGKNDATSGKLDTECSSLRREHRLARNRETARDRRARKKRHIEDLENSLESLKKENHTLKEENASLRMENLSLSSNVSALLATSSTGETRRLGLSNSASHAVYPTSAALSSPHMMTSAILPGADPGNHWLSSRAPLSVGHQAVFPPMLSGQTRLILDPSLFSGAPSSGLQLQVDVSPPAPAVFTQGNVPPIQSTLVFPSQNFQQPTPNLSSTNHLPVTSDVTNGLMLGDTSLQSTLPAAPGSVLLLGQSQARQISGSDRYSEVSSRSESKNGWNI